MTNEERLYEELEARFGKRIADGFRESIEELARAADVERAITALLVGDIEAALAAMHIDAAAYGPFADAIRDTFHAGGQFAVSGLPALTDAAGAALVIRYNARALSAERWLREHSGQLITRIVEEQRQAIRASLTSTLEAGRNPRAAIPGIVGRYDPRTRSRVGGIIGLTVPQERWVEGARSELVSDDPADLRAYLSRQARDKTYDRAVNRAIRDGRRLPADVASKALAGYKSGLLRVRGETIARTELLTSLNAGRFQAYRQAVDDGQLDPLSVTKVWRDSRDGRVRDSHLMLNGESARLLDPFISPTGSRMMHPGDTSLGARGRDVINCRCRFEVRIDRFYNLT